MWLYKPKEELTAWLVPEWKWWNLLPAANAQHFWVSKLINSGGFNTYQRNLFSSCPSKLFDGITLLKEQQVTRSYKVLNRLLSQYKGNTRTSLFPIWLSLTFFRCPWSLSLALSVTASRIENCKRIFFLLPPWLYYLQKNQEHTANQNDLLQQSLYFPADLVCASGTRFNSFQPKGLLFWCP